MNAPITASTLQESTSIANRAMKFRLSRGGTQKRVRDKDAEAVVKSQFGDEGQIVSRELFKDKNNLVYKYQSLGNEMYGYHVKSTLPFGDDSSRLLPNAAYFTYTTTMQGYISQLDQLKNQIITNWNQMVQDDVNARNASLFAQGKPQAAVYTDYPTALQMTDRLFVNWYPEAISTSGDFRFTLPQEMLTRVDEQISAMVADAGRELYVRMLKPVTAFVQKLSVYKGEKDQRFSSSFVDNLNALSSELPHLNINNDPEVTRLLGEIDAIVKPYAFAPDALKESDAARAAVKAKLEALENTLKGYAL